MKVVYLCAKHPRYDKRIFYKISVSLSKNGLDVVNICPNAKKTTKFKIKTIGFEQKEGYLKRFYSLIKLYKLGLKQHADVIIAPEPDSLVIAYWIKRKQKKIKLLFDSHEYYYKYFDNIFKNKLISSVFNILVDKIINYVVKRIYGVMVVTERMKKKYKKINERAYLIPNTNDIVSKGKYNYNKNSYLMNKKYFIYEGLFYYPEIIINTAKLLRRNNINVSILLLGGFSKNSNYSKNVSEFRKIVFGENLQEYITFIEWVPFYGMQQYIINCIAGLVIMNPNDYLYYALPNKLFDYMALGVPIITFDFPEITKIVKEEKCGIVVKEIKEELLVDAMLTMMKNKRKREIMAKNSYLAMKNKYDWSFYAKTLIKIIRE